jgi:transposase, IS30 family
MSTTYTHLTYELRCQIYALKQSGKSQSAIARQLGVSQSTISRELCRNKGGRGYRYKQAHRKATHRRHLASVGARAMTAHRLARIQHLLCHEQWSPEQIAAHIRASDGVRLCHETIYRHIWHDKKHGGTLYTHLRQRGKKRNKRGNANAGRGLIPHRRDISERPAIVAEKVRVGDWEVDSIIGSKHRGSLVTMVERVSKLVRIVLLDRPTAHATKDAMIAALQPLKHSVHTITSDNGKEFAAHQDIAAGLEADFFFATPYHAWERGVNENTNGLIRQYFPKGTDFGIITHAQVRTVQNKLNNRPRKTLNYLTPNQAFAQLTTNQNYALRM